jgi:hypothetical protein
MLIAANVKRRDIQRSAAIVHAKTIEQILTALDSTEKRHDDLAAYQQRMMRLRLISTVVVLLAYAGVLAYAAAKLWSARHTGAWSPFWDALKVVWETSGFLGIGSIFYEQAQQAGQAHVLRERVAMRALQQELAPAQWLQLPVPDELFTGGGQFSPFERLERGRALDMAQALILSIPVAAGFLLALIVVLIFAQLPTPADVAFFTLLLGLPGALFAWLTLLVLRRLRRMRRPFWVSAGEWGLGWEKVTGRNRQTRLSWDQVRAFFVIAEPDAKDDAFSVYVVQGSGMRLTWAMPRAPTPEQRAANDALRRVISTRTGLPLTEVSAATLSPEDYGVTAPDPSPAMPQVSPRVARFLSLAWLVPLALTLLLTIGGLILQHG